MGLDMYLTAEKYVSSYDFAAEKEKALYREIVALTDAGQWVDPETPSANLSLTVGYWRKANQVHAWFVEHVQSGVDDCSNYDVDRAQLRDLRSLCSQALATRDLAFAETALPTQDGFFFGGTDYDDYYWQNLEDTVAQIDRALTVPEGWYFKYHSSW